MATSHSKAYIDELHHADDVGNIWEGRCGSMRFRCENTSPNSWWLRIHDSGKWSTVTAGMRYDSLRECQDAMLEMNTVWTVTRGK